MKIEVAKSGSAFAVEVGEGADRTRHEVTADAAYLEKLAPGRPPERVIEAAFRFLLDREPKEAILVRFDLGEIKRYFPEFEREFGTYLRGV